MSQELENGSQEPNEDVVERVRERASGKKKAVKKDPVKEKKPVKEKFYKVVFSARSKETDPEDVMLSCNGDQIILQREKEVLIAGRHLEVADHCAIPQVRQNPGEGFKVKGILKKYPYSIISDQVTEKEYREARRANSSYSKRVWDNNNDKDAD